MIRIYVCGPQVPASLVDLFQARGDVVSRGEPVPQDADLYLFRGGDERMKRLAQGLVILDLRGEPDLSSAHWSAYADLCLVADDASRAALVEVAGCEAERIFVLAEEADVLELADRARQDNLPPASVQQSTRRATMAAPTAAPDLAALAARLEFLERQADVMHRDYEVRSRLPLVGPLVVWVRRNLTSHLREPYLDPILERQVRLNHDLVAVLQELLRRQALVEAQIEKQQDDDNV